MKRRKIMIACIILFIAINGLLVYLDDNGTVERKSYVNEWSEVFQANLYNKMEKSGVLTAINKNNVYFDKSLGSFQEFLVEKGTQVNQGDQLYTYRVHDYYETKEYLTSQADQLEGEIAAIEDAIAEISSYRIPTVQIQTGEDEEGNEIVTTLPSIESEYMKEQYLIEKEKELGRAEAKLASIESQLTELDSSGDTITVESPYNGKVTLVSESLQDPIITIAAQGLHIEGELTERERTIIQQEMPVEIAVNENNVMLKGSIATVSELPENIDLHNKSEYPFSVAFAEDADLEGLLPGYHANLSITTKKAENATALFEDTIYSNTIWKMRNDGTLYQQKIETGMEMASMQQITKGAKVGEWIAEDPEEEFRTGATFVTPLKESKINWNDALHFTYKDWGKYLVIGVLAR